MSMKFAQGKFNMKNPEKYLGNNTPQFRSGWEFTVMTFCDTNPAVHQWASESIKIPYRDPLTGKHTVYVPDFLVIYVDRHHKKHAELWEIKPAKQSIIEKVGKNAYDQAQFIKNQAKWASANAWAKQNGIIFRVINEGDIYHNGNKRR